MSRSGVTSILLEQNFRQTSHHLPPFTTQSPDADPTHMTPQELIDNPPSAAFVATMGHQVVGVFVANREACGGDEVARIRSEFEVEDYIAFDRHRPRNQAVMTALALNPIFAGHCRFALKEVWLRAHLACVCACVRVFLIYVVSPNTSAIMPIIMAGRQRCAS